MPLRIAHRGASGTHPENTMSAFVRAVELGAQGIELDVQRTLDGHLVVMHDATLDRTTNGTGVVMAMTLEEIRQLDAGSWKGERFAGEPVPTLAEVLRAVPPEVHLFVELKAGSLHFPGIEAELVALLRQEGAFGRVQVSSFDHYALRRLHQHDPELPLGMLYSSNLLDPVALARQVGAQAIHPPWEWVTADLVRTAHEAGMQVNTWTVNHPMLIELVKLHGVDGIMSDHPELI